jgi:magnesium-transporting ATPase (P-type)
MIWHEEFSARNLRWLKFFTAGLLFFCATLAWQADDLKATTVFVLVALAQAYLGLSFKDPKTLHSVQVGFSANAAVNRTGERLHQKLRKFIFGMSIAGLICATILTIFSLHFHTTFQETVRLALALAVALSPSALLPALLYHLNQNPLQKRRLSHLARHTLDTARMAIHSSFTDISAKLSLVLLGFIGYFWYNIPLAVTIMSLLALDLLIQLPVLMALKWSPGRLTLPDNPQADFTAGRTIFGFACFGLLAAGLAYANFLFYFERHNLSPEFLSTSSGIYAKAASLALITLGFCQLINVLFSQRLSRREFFSYKLWSNQYLIIAFGLSLFLMINIVYNPWLKSLLGTGPLDDIDWFYAALAATSYLVIRTIQRYSRKYSRREVLKLLTETPIK